MRSDLDGIERQIAALDANKSKLDWKWIVGIIFAIFAFCNVTITQVRVLTAHAWSAATSYLSHEVSQLRAPAESAASPSSSPSPARTSVSSEVHEKP
jgi:hypothetical protein